LADAGRPLTALLLLAACGGTWTWRTPPVSREARTALADVRLAQPLEHCLPRALGSAESASYLGPLDAGDGELQAHRLRVYVSPVAQDRFLDARVIERRCPGGEVALELLAAPKGTTYDAEPEILELRLDSIAEHVVAVCRAKAIAFERGHMVDRVPEICGT